MVYASHYGVIIMPTKESGIMKQFKEYQNIARDTGRAVATPLNLANKVKQLVQQSMGKLKDWINNVVEALHDLDTRLTTIESVLSLDDTEPVNPDDIITENVSNDPLDNPL